MVTLLLTGCGGANSEQKLDIEGQLGHAQFAANTFCLGVSEGGAGGPGGGEAVAVLTRLLDQWPDEKSVRQGAQDIAASLDDQCGEDGTRYAKQLRHVLQQN